MSRRSGQQQNMVNFHVRTLILKLFFHVVVVDVDVGTTRTKFDVLDVVLFVFSVLHFLY